MAVILARAVSGESDVGILVADKKTRPRFAPRGRLDRPISPSQGEAKATPGKRRCDLDPELEFLVVDDFLRDLISFKSMLHDWPENAAKTFLTRAAEAVEPGGSILIFERAPLDVTTELPPFSSLPTMLFFRSYRPPAIYAGHLLALGFIDIQTREVPLEVPFFVVTGKKSRSGPPAAFDGDIARR
jgi:hypothetical protein